MRKILVLLLTLLPFMCAAQEFTTLNFKQAKERASQEKKIILVDVTNSRMLSNPEKLAQDKRILSLEGVAGFLERSVIAIRIDMGTEEGKEFAPLLQMNMYPTYAFVMPDGDLLSVANPFLIERDPSLFLKKANEAYAKAEEKWSNSRSIIFSGVSFDEALNLAKKENKLIFIDAYTDNCQPCIMMEKNIFTLDKVADFYNSNFINLSLNLGTEHKELAERYKTFAYPTFLYINSKGDLVLSESGFTEAEEFIEYGKKAISKSSIQFTSGTWNEILELAKKHNKPIFVDCYTVWCGPCKQMASDVFTNAQVADYYNGEFINVKFDMEKGEGITLKEKYEVKAYPTFLYIDKNGEVLNRIVGAMPAEKFMELTKNGMSEHGLASMKRRYSQGERGEEFIRKYLNVLEQGYMQKEAQQVVCEYFKTTDLDALKKPENWMLFEKYIEDVDSEVFKYVYKNRDQFGSQYTRERLDPKLFMVWAIGSRKFVTRTPNGAEFDKKGFDNYIKRMKNEGVDRYTEIEENAKMYNADVLNNWKEYISLVETKIKKAGGVESVHINELYNWGLRIDQNCSDIKLRTKASKWFKTMLPVIEERENRRKEEAKRSGGTMAMSMVNYQKEFARLAESLSKSLNTDKQK